MLINYFDNSSMLSIYQNIFKNNPSWKGTIE